MNWEKGFEAGIAFALRHNCTDIHRFIAELARLRTWKTHDEWRELVEKNVRVEEKANDPFDRDDNFYLHANSVNALQGALSHGPTKDLPCAQAMDSIVHHLQCEIYILMDEIERLKESKTDA